MNDNILHAPVNCVNAMLQQNRNKETAAREKLV
jgi:hypothetical protein